MADWKTGDNRCSRILQSTSIITECDGAGRDPVRSEDNVGIPRSRRAFKGHVRGVKAVPCGNRQRSFAGVVAETVKRWGKLKPVDGAQSNC